MSDSVRPVTRRQFLGYTAGSFALSFASPGSVRAAAGPMIRRKIPGQDQSIPAIGMGTWITFNVGKNAELRRSRLEVLNAFFEGGGGLIDSSPMYGSAQDVIGWCLKNTSQAKNLVSATKVWTPAGGSAEQQMADARSLWGLPSIDLMQIHNLVDWRDHLKVLRRAKDAGQIKYIGITTSHGSRHTELEKIMRDEPLDFVQFTYNIQDRQAENRLLPLAHDRNLAVIINRPFRGGRLFRSFADQPLPGFASDMGCENWAEVFLKFILSQPAVTCAIPATSKVTHMRQNMAALYGRLPSVAESRQLAKYVENL